MDHLEHLEIVSPGDMALGAKSLEDRALGRFYTPLEIANLLTKELVRAFPQSSPSSIRAIDPFCGDGRLIVALLNELANHPKYNGIQLDLWLWDCDKAALRKAVLAVSESIREN